MKIYENINVVYGYMHGVWRYRKSGLIIAWVVAIVGWAAIYALPNKYEVSTTVNIDTSSIMRPLLEGLAIETDTRDETSIMTRVLLSRETLDSVVTETGLDKDIHDKEGREQLLMSLKDRIILKNTLTGRGKYRSDLYEISFESDSALEAHKLVSTLLKTLIKDTMSSDSSDTVMAQNFLNEQILKYEMRLTEAEQRLADFKKKNVGFMPDDKGGYYERLQAAQRRIENTRSLLRQAKHRFADIRQQVSGQNPVVNGAPRPGSGKLLEYQEYLAELLTQFTEQHPDVQAMRAKIANLEEALRSASKSVSNNSSISELNPIYQELKLEEASARVEVGRLQIQLSEDKEAFEELEASIDIIPQVEANLAKLGRDYEITKERYLSLVERREATRMTQEAGENSGEILFQVVEAPVIPVIPSGPNRLLLLTGVLMVALVAGISFSVLMFLLYPTYVDFKQLKNKFALPVLGSISLHKSAEQVSERYLQIKIYLLGLLLLFAAYGGVVMFKNSGPGLIQEVRSIVGYQL